MQSSWVLCDNWNSSCYKEVQFVGLDTKTGYMNDK